MNLQFNDFLLNSVDDYLESNKVLNFDKPIMTKKDSHSLFSPVLSFCINYLNSHKNEDNKKIGFFYDKKMDLKFIYICLDKTIYDLFFLKRKKNLNGFDIDFSGEEDNENYIIFQSEGEKNLFTQSEIEVEINEQSFYQLRKKEIISKFRRGYSIQEEIIENFFLNNEKFMNELPNLLLFHQYNNKNKYFCEFDRILFIEKKIDINKIFKYYLKFEITYEDVKEETFFEGKIINLEKNSVNFIEIKSSAVSILYELNNNNESN